MKIYCAYTNPSDATLISLQPYIDQSTFIDCSDDKWAYVKHFQRRWSKGEGFINVERILCGMNCSIENCARPVLSRGWCSLHYQRWQRHGDICFWPGAIESLTACPRAFCWFDDQWALKASRKNYARFGLVKLSAYLISQTKDVWDDLLRRYESIDPPSPWNMCDTFFFDYVRDHTEITPHEHTPGTINVNTTYYHGVISSIRQELSCSTG